MCADALGLQRIEQFWSTLLALWARGRCCQSPLARHESAGVALQQLVGVLLVGTSRGARRWTRNEPSVMTCSWVSSVSEHSAMLDNETQGDDSGGVAL